MKKSRISVKRIGTVEVLTSGYADRYPHIEGEWFVTVRKRGKKNVLRFSSREKTIDFLESMCGLNLDDAWDIVMKCEYERRISGWNISGKNPYWISRKVSDDEYASISAYLSLRYHYQVNGVYNDEAVAQFQQVLTDHPLDAETSAILEYKIGECDHHNETLFGHKNGRSGG